MQNSATINSTVTQGGTINSTVTVGTTIQSTLTGGGIGPKGDTGARGAAIYTAPLASPPSSPNIGDLWWVNDSNAGAVGVLNYRGTWTHSTQYNPYDVVVWQGTSFYCTTAHTSSNSGFTDNGSFELDFNAGYWAALGRRQQWYDVRDYGAMIDGATNDTTAINNAIIAASNAGGGFVYIPVGITLVTQVVIRNNVTVVGAGRESTIIYALSNTNTSTVINYVSPDGVIANGMNVGIRDLRIDGHLANSNFSRDSGPSGAGNTSINAHGIYFNTNPTNSQATYDPGFDTHQLVMNVDITNCPGWGFFQSGRSETRLINVNIGTCIQGGFCPSYDTYIWGCNAGNNQGPGFQFSHGDITCTGCKSFLNGMSFAGGTATNSPGFYITGNGISCSLAACESQNNSAQGYYVYNAAGITIHGAADSNNYGTGNSNTAYAGIELYNSSNCIISIIGTQGVQSGSVIGNQYSTLRVNNSSNNNDIHVTQYDQAGYTGGPIVTTDSVYLNNRIIANGQQLSPYSTTPVVTTITSSATPTMNTSTSNVLNITALATNITSMTTNLTGTNVDTQTLIVRITDNGTTRSITWGASFEASGTIALPTATTPGTMLTIGFIWNVTTSAWHIVGVS